MSEEKVVAYECPICKTLNPKSVKYCVKCGHWLLDTTAPAKEITVEQYKNEFGSVLRNKSGKYRFWIIAIVYGLLFCISPYYIKGLLAVLAGLVGVISIFIPLRVMGINKRKTGIFILIVSLILITYSSSITPASTGSTTTLGVKTYKINDVFQVGYFTYRVNSLQDSKTIGSKILNKQTKANYIIIGISAKNNSKEARNIGSSMFKLKTPDGTEYSADTTASIYLDNAAENFISSQVNPNIQIDGYIVFEVPKKSTEQKYVLEISGGLLSNKKISINLVK